MRETFKSGVSVVVSIPGGQIPAASTVVLDFGLTAAFNVKDLLLEGDVLAVDIVKISCGTRSQPIPPFRDTDIRSLRTVDLGSVDTVRVSEYFSVSVSNRTDEEITITGFLRLECQTPDAESILFLRAGGAI